MPNFFIFQQKVDLLLSWPPFSAGLLYSVLITAVITDAIKDAVGRPRPDFFWRCFPDGKEVAHRSLTLFSIFM